jgi:hypothetical protein
MRGSLPAPYRKRKRGIRGEIPKIDSFFYREIKACRRGSIITDTGFLGRFLCCPWPSYKKMGDARRE